MARRPVSPPIMRWLSGLVASVAMVAAVTAFIALINPHVPPLSFLMLYLLVVLPVAVVWGTVFAVVTSVLSVAVYVYAFEVADAPSAVALGVFLITAVVVGELAARLRRAALASARLTEEQSALRRVATLVARSVPPPVVFEAVTEEVGRLCDADLARMERYEPDGTVTGTAVWSRVPERLSIDTRFDLDGPSVARDVRQTGSPVRIDTFDGATGAIAREARALGIRSSVGCPVVVAGRLWGVIAASKKSDQPFPANTEAQIANFTELVATAVENAEARAELTVSRARIVATADQTRRRIERDLHDGVQQRLVSLALQVQAAEAAVPPDRDELGAELEQIAAGLADAVDELREMARGIHPAILAEGGLASALKALARRSPIPVDLAMRTGGKLLERVEVSAYFVVSEALTNAAKHAHASAVTVTVEVADDVLHVSVHDDGVGGADFAGGTGLVGLKDRVRALGGRLSLESRRDQGTTLWAELPLTGATV
ncbi:MAG TPA: GAF domain-containing sensor histidine kinase [Actinoplanes sp.]|nr:GAF domain-containing sensor histidine kinase [Actinoplanes sp.]